MIESDSFGKVTPGNAKDWRLSYMPGQLFANVHRTRGIIIAGNHGSAGKTTVTIGLCAAFTARGLIVQPFKKGPDFIDPMWLTRASGNRQCRNLDRFMMGEQLLPLFSSASHDADFSVIEGNRALFDSYDEAGSGSTAALARELNAPILLVVDVKKIARSVAALVQGFINFESGLTFAGIILNNIAGKRHEKKIISALEQYCDINILGAVYNNAAMEIRERHLGLIPSVEMNDADRHIEKIKEIIEESVNLEQILQIIKVSNLTSATPAPEKNAVKIKSRIGVARDSAFGFYYPENLDALRKEGAELIEFSPLKEKQLPDIDALYIGGGFPEIYMDKLEENFQLRHEIRSSVNSGLPVYAECGGMIYLARKIIWKGVSKNMVGALPCDIEMTSEPQGRGYVMLETHLDLKENKVKKEGKKINYYFWSFPTGLQINAHEFHYSKILNISDEISYIYKVQRGIGIEGKNDGIKYKNVLATYAHIHILAAPWWASEFVRSAMEYRKMIKTAAME